MCVPNEQIDIAAVYQQSSDRERQAIRMAKAWVDGWTMSPEHEYHGHPVLAAPYERVVTMLAALLLRFDDERV